MKALKGATMDEQKQEVGKEEPKVEDRPIENYKAELERRKAREVQLQTELDAMKEAQKTPVHDNNSSDLTRWDDNSLRLLKNSPKPEHQGYKEDAENILVERKFRALRAKEREEERRENVSKSLVDQYPDALDPSSEFSQKMNKVMQEYDLGKTPAGKLAAARIVAAEGKSSGKTSAQVEADRVAALKANMTDGDRPKPVDMDSPQKKDKSLKERILNSKTLDSDAIGEWADSKGLREKFNKVWGS